MLLVLPTELQLHPHPVLILLFFPPLPPLHLTSTHNSCPHQESIEEDLEKKWSIALVFKGTYLAGSLTVSVD